MSTENTGHWLNFAVFATPEECAAWLGWRWDPERRAMVDPVASKSQPPENGAAA